LNKQYSKEEYGTLKKRIIGHMRAIKEWGEYFPPEASPFAYNESVAFDFFPLTRDEALRRGYPWYDRPTREYTPTVKASGLPETIAATTNVILHETIGCLSQESEEGKAKYPECATAFKLVQLELGLYRKLNLPVPQKCFPCRRKDRFALRNPRQLWKRHCGCAGRESANAVYRNTVAHQHGVGKCPNEFETSYPPDRPEIVYCEQCYNAEVA
jgi:hypothetical protein